MASVRIGAATVDTKIDQETVRPGETLDARVVVEGGEVDQAIEEIDLQLKTKRERDDTYRTFTIDSYHVADSFTIHEDETRTFDVEWDIDRETPVTTLNARRDRAEVWIDTDLEIDNAIDADDTDSLAVEPTPPMEATLTAVDRAGYSLSEVTVDDDHINVGGERSTRPIDQEIVFRPDGRSEFEEIEVHFLPRDDQTHVLLEFDRRRSENFDAIRIDHDDYSVDSIQRRFEQAERKN